VVVLVVVLMSTTETKVSEKVASLPSVEESNVQPKKYRRKKRGQTLAKKKAKVTTPRWEPNYRQPASRFLLPEHQDILRTIRKPKKGETKPKKLPIGNGLSHKEAVKVMLATMKQRVAQYAIKKIKPALSSTTTTDNTTIDEANAPDIYKTELNTTLTNNGAKRQMDMDISTTSTTRRQSSAYADSLAFNKAVANFEQKQFEDRKNNVQDIGESDPLYNSGLTWGEITEKRQRRRKNHEVFPSTKSKKSGNPGLSEADPLRGCVSVIERPDFRWTLEGQKEGRRSHLMSSSKLPLLVSKSIHFMQPDNLDKKKEKIKKEKLEKEYNLKQDILNVARKSTSLISTWARYRATYRILLPTFMQYFQKPPEEDSLLHIGDLVMVHQKATNIWISASVEKIDGFDPDADPEENQIHAHHEKHRDDNATNHQLDTEGEEEHKRLRTEDIDFDSDDEGRGHGKDMTEKDDEERQYKVMVNFKNRDRTVDQKIWIECNIGRLRRQISLDPKLCDNLHHEMALLRPMHVGGLPRVGDKVVVSAVEFHCAELYTKLGLLPIGICTDQRHITDACKIEIFHAVLNKKWIGWYNNRHVQVVTDSWYRAIQNEWKRMEIHASNYKTKEMLEQEALELSIKL
jgi:hypothetical protein